ncbi:hypothetical protein C4572_03855 [Candidatus Parcubacteria bacterium]|nr:MAG: hypothetical protein C4572_03855 [Candidatus Parcubacteria bacterium]
MEKRTNNGRIEISKRKMQNSKLKLKTRKRGFTLLLSLLVVSVVLTVSLGVFEIMTKEIKLSGVGRESQISFYAADAGIECFYFWEVKHPGLTQSAFALGGENNINSVVCGQKKDGSGNNVSGVSNQKFDGDKTSSFSLTLGEGDNIRCANVEVSKEDKGRYIETAVKSRGYNTSCDSNSPRKVERAIRMTVVRKIAEAE